MPKVTFIDPDGTTHMADVRSGTSAMQSAVNNGIPGIDGDCGGNCACATCHVYVGPDWIEKIGPPRKDMEKRLLEFAEDIRESSRLACQIIITDDLDGLVLELPVGQH